MVKKNFGIKDAGIALSMYLWGKVGKGNRIKWQNDSKQRWKRKKIEIPMEKMIFKIRTAQKTHKRKEPY